MKKIISLSFLVAILLLPMAAKMDFDDAHGTRSSRAVQYLEEKGVIEGYQDGTFRPDQDISRAEFLKIVLEASEDYEDACTDPKIAYPDVSEDDWFYSYVCYATNNDIVAGYPDGTFKPDNKINFVEAAKIVANLYDLEITEDENGEWYQAFVDALGQERVIPGTIAKMNKDISRGEMSEIIWGIQTGNEVENEQLGDLPQVNSCAELSTQMAKYQKRNSVSYYNGYRDGGFLEDDVDMVFAEEADDAVGAAAPTPTAEQSMAKSQETDTGASAEYSTTNVQEFGVDEADIVKNDGSHIFLIKGNTVRIVKAYPPENMMESAILEVDGDSFYPREMYLDEDKLVIIGNGGYSPWVSQGSARLASKEYYPYYDYNTLKVFVYDVSDRTSPSKVRSVTFDANYVSSRKIEDVVYVVANKANYYRGEPILEDDLPKFDDSAFEDEEIVSACGGVHYFPNFSDPNYLIISAIDINDTSKKVEREMFLGSGSEIYASTDNLYVTRPVWEEVYYKDGTDEGWTNGEFTQIFKFNLDGTNIKYKAKGKAEGRILNQFSMSESGDYFRIATQKGQAWGNSLSETMVTILDKDLEETGKVDEIAPGENMKSARFMGNRAYLVTFKTVDPLFVVDLDPENPRVLGKLKIPGWSDYLHPYDENHLIGFGKEVDESIDADKIHSDHAIYYTAVLGMKLAIFDVSDVENPKEIHKEVIGYRGTTSEVLNNHKALLFDKNKGILAFPITVTENKSDEHGYDADIQTVFAGAYVYDIDLENGFSLKGKVSNYDDDDDVYLKSGEYFYGDYNKNIQRMIYIGDYFYSVAPGFVKALNWDDISVANTVELEGSEVQDSPSRDPYWFF